MPNLSIDRPNYLARWGYLKTERSSWFSHWNEISTRLMPRAGRFFVQDRNKGNKRHNQIYDSSATQALSILAAGMMSGMTSPARPWFRLTTGDDDLDSYQPVKIWLDQVTRLMLKIFQGSNTYRALHSMYEELGGFGTAASIMVPDFRSVIHHHPLTAGEYAITTDWRGDVATLYREFQKTVGQIVKEFGYKACSPTVQNLYDRGNLEAWVTIIHAIEPRADRDPSKNDPQNMAWKSVYFEIGGNQQHCLRESGFKRFPALVPRWVVRGGDIYGESPAMTALGDINQLQHQQLRKAQGIDYKTRPPLQAPTSMKNRDVEMLPGGITYVDSANPHGGIRSAFEVNIDLQHLLGDIRDVRERIRSCFFADLFMMLANQTDARMTATEVAERHEEKLLMLGPVLERLQNELLDPLIENTFDAIMEAGIAPPAPDELQGRPLNVDLIGMLAQAQRAVGTNSIDRFVGNLGAVAQFKPEVLDRFDSDRWAEVYSDSLSLDPQIIVPRDQAQAIREQRAQAQAQAQQAALAEQQASTAQKLASAKTDQPNALTDATRAFQGYS
ncbi:MAG TPA: portal protein [Burkholderiaceae bacterium]|nr:portal protein [Burkholderiaceae bacterium]